MSVVLSQHFNLNKVDTEKAFDKLDNSNKIDILSMMSSVHSNQIHENAGDKRRPAVNDNFKGVQKKLLFPHTENLPMNYRTQENQKSTANDCSRDL